VPKRGGKKSVARRWSRGAPPRLVRRKGGKKTPEMGENVEEEKY